VTLNGKKYRDYKVNFKTEKSSVSKEYDISWLTEASSEPSSQAESDTKPESQAESDSETEPEG
ncbi:MAG: hypothetical protein IIY89_09875, partial [Clostridia bacterium]|nr:hypothetical protein [Clostridia bacterium]